METGPLVVNVIKKIIGRISNGTYPIGKRLPAERELCRQVNISRGTLRKALADLEELGVVARRHGSGTVVTRLAPRRLPSHVLPTGFRELSLEDVNFARKTIELAALDYCNGRLSNMALKRMKTLVDLMAENLYVLPEFLRYDAEFHQVLVQAGGNPAIFAAYCAIEEYRRFLHIYTTLNEKDEEISLEYHRKILAALQARNKTLAKRHLTAHLNDVVKNAIKTRKK